MRVIHVDFGFDNDWQFQVVKQMPTKTQRDDRTIYLVLEDVKPFQETYFSWFTELNPFYDSTRKQSVKCKYAVTSAGGSVDVTGIIGRIDLCTQKLNEEPNKTDLLRQIRKQSDLPELTPKKYKLPIGDEELLLTKLRFFINEASTTGEEYDDMNWVKWKSFELEAEMQHSNGRRVCFQVTCSTEDQFLSKKILLPNNPQWDSKELLSKELLKGDHRLVDILGDNDSWKLSTTCPDDDAEPPFFFSRDFATLMRAFPELLDTILSNSKTQIRVEELALYRSLAYAAGSLAGSAVMGILYFVPVIAAAILSLGLPHVVVAGVLLTLMVAGLVVAGLCVGQFLQDSEILTRLKEAWDTRRASPPSGFVFVPTTTPL